jgi:hypothetical protein
MLYFILTLFFGSLLGIIFMIGRKIILIQNGQAPEYPEVSNNQEWEEFKYEALKGLKRLGYALLVEGVRLYVKLISYLKNLSRLIIRKIQKVYYKKLETGTGEPRESSKFLKMVGQYKRKLRRIKEKVKEEENL